MNAEEMLNNFPELLESLKRHQAQMNERKNITKIVCALIARYTDQRIENVIHIAMGIYEDIKTQTEVK